MAEDSGGDHPQEISQSDQGQVLHAQLSGGFSRTIYPGEQAAIDRARIADLERRLAAIEALLGGIIWTDGEPRLARYTPEPARAYVLLRSGEWVASSHLREGDEVVMETVTAPKAPSRSQ